MESTIFRKKPEDHSHESAEISKRLDLGQSGDYLRDLVFGGIDGAVTSFAIVSGVVGASLSSGIILVLGIANLLADGFSMAASNYSATRSDLEKREHLIHVEHKHLQLYREGEKEELRQILSGYGYKDMELEVALNAIQANPQLWVELMLKGEYGVTSIPQSPVKSALATWSAFVFCGSIPLLPFLLRFQNAFTLAMVMTGFVFFFVGAIKTRWTRRHWLTSGIETLAVGSLAALIAYVCGVVLAGIVPNPDL